MAKQPGISFTYHYLSLCTAFVSPFIKIYMTGKRTGRGGKETKMLKNRNYVIVGREVNSSAMTQTVARKGHVKQKGVHTEKDDNVDYPTTEHNR